MKSTLLFFFGSLFLASCASVFNEHQTTVKVYTTRPSKIIIDNDTIKTFINKAKLTFRREKKILKIKIIADSIEKNLVIKPMNSFMYYNNILTYGLGFLVDRKKMKRYTYPKRLFLNSSDTLSKYFGYEQGDKTGQTYLHLSLPYVNSFLLRPEDEPIKQNTGFWGISVGFDHYISNNRFLNVSATAASDFFVPVPAAVDIRGEYELMSSMYLSMSNNHKVKRFSFGYGLSYSKNSWDLQYHDQFNPPPPKRPPVTKSNDAFGLIFSSYFQTGKSFNVGLIYKPTLMRLHTPQPFQYEHLISVDFAWKLY